MYDIYLSYTGFKCYKTCPKQYYFRYIIKDKSVFDVKNTLLGSTIGKIFEWFYDQKFWSYQNVSELAVNSIDKAIDHVFLKENYQAGSDAQFEHNLREDLVKYVSSGVEIIKKHKLLTTNSCAELDLTTTFSSPIHNISVKIGGIADFVHYNRPNDVWIMDGKAYKKREKYVDSNQLIWYSILHYMKYGVAPSKIGFIYWLFPDDPVSYISYNSDSMRVLHKDIIDTSKMILSKQFEPKTSSECRRCSYLNKCDDGTKYLAKKRKESTDFVGDSIFDLEDVT